MDLNQSRAAAGSNGLLPLNPEIGTDDLLRNLRMNALLSHQISVGAGDELVSILKRTIEQMQKTHNRIQNMNTILFASGLVILGAGLLMAFRGGSQAPWASLLGVSGGVTSLAATFWTAPLDKVSASITDLVKLEAAFLGYIRVIGEIDSAFQMQYLDILSGNGRVSLDNVMNDTTNQMKEMMTHTLGLIDQYVSTHLARDSRNPNESKRPHAVVKAGHQGAQPGD